MGLCYSYQLMINVELTTINSNITLCLTHSIYIDFSGLHPYGWGITMRGKLFIDLGKVRTEFMMRETCTWSSQHQAHSRDENIRHFFSFLTSFTIVNLYDGVVSA